ncbi:acyl-CoA dehydrogenase [Mycolicibacterium chubuense NBB4]|uniref:Acyl-CoA dehydrogenase n=1 Tax=Mycolicibacterium chubuense (strain NBB4) TaxID=710421 RepID=I4BHG3_MYCCN|nr:acyl-CoA dehydrogenase family protein [Mycolicibacterium chubuense]AFM16720.1 acyl-CoA dehydrogenase [Mycolicibacterium chubuense NBB4]
MNLEYTDEQVALRDTVRRYLSEKASVSGHVRAMLDDPTGTTDAVWRGLVDLGTTSLLVPADRGGDGMSMTEAGIVSEELGAALHPGPWLSSAVAAPRALAHFGADGTRTCELFAAVADGSVIATVAVAPPGDAALAADLHADGAILRGEIAPVPDAAAAHVLLVAGFGPHAKLFAVELNSPGVDVEAIPDVDPTRKNFRVVFTRAAAHVVAESDSVNSAAEALVDDIIIARAADALGAARQVLQMTVEHAKVRRQFGAAIGSFQAVAHLCVDMHETVELARSGLMYALWAADHAGPGERRRAALRVKAFAGQLAAVGDLAIQVCGGIGFTWEHDTHLYLKRLLSFSRFLGSPGGYLEQVGRELARGRA